MAQERKSRSTEDQEQVDAPATDETVADRKAKVDEDVDAMLEEIDDVLETNAEEFVRGFVQKGGQ
jgi:prokaryotic ubiquitin-like protein Pup